VNATTTAPTVTPRQELLRDIAITAVEGGIGYWSSCARYRWSNATNVGPDDMLPFPEVELAANETPDDFDGLLPDVPIVRVDRKWGRIVKLTPELIERAIAKIKADAALVNTTTRRNVILADVDNDASQIDADDADCIVQIALFGTLVFG
jgi:hypothetical protein